MSGSYYYMQDDTLLTREGKVEDTNDSEDEGFLLAEPLSSSSSSSSSPSSTIVTKHNIHIKFRLLRTYAVSNIIFKSLLPAIGLHLTNVINMELYPESYQVLVYRVQLNLVIMTAHAMLMGSSRISSPVYTLVDRIHSFSCLLNIAHILWTWLLFRRRHLYTSNVDGIATVGLLALYIILVTGVIVIAVRERGGIHWNMF